MAYVETRPRLPQSGFFQDFLYFGVCQCAHVHGEAVLDKVQEGVASTALGVRDITLENFGYFGRKILHSGEISED